MPLRLIDDGISGPVSRPHVRHTSYGNSKRRRTQGPNDICIIHPYRYTVAVARLEYSCDLEVARYSISTIGRRKEALDR